MQRALTLAIMMAVVLSGCATKTGGDDPIDPVDDEDLAPGTLGADGKTVITKVQNRNKLGFETDLTSFSKTLIPGNFSILPAVGYTLQIAQPVGTGLPAADVHMGIFFPEIPGCDYPVGRFNTVAVAGIGIGAAMPGTEDMPEHCKVPVVADVGPYWGEPILGDVHAESRNSGRLGEFMIQNLVPHGYAVAQVSVTGTGDSTGCMDLMGPVEQEGVQEAVRFLGDAGWSNGNVGLIGRSYDGSTPWEAAMAADLPQLKTVVPISGLYGQFDLMWKNGSVETRGPGVLWGLYYVFTYTGNDPASTGGDTDAALLQGRQIAENLVCAETQTGGAVAAGSYLYGGDPIRPYQEEGGYWEERSFGAEVLQNYQGSVYFIHGMQDWNVDPHMAFPFYNDLEAKGLDMKGLFGQWGHSYPDRFSEHSGLAVNRDNVTSVRHDWAQDLLEWFDHYLMGTGAKPQLHVEMQDDHGTWRIESTWPPADTAWKAIPINGADGTLEPAGGFGPVQAPGAACTGVGPTCRMVFDLGVLDASNDTRIAGLPKFHVDVTPQGAGGQLGLTLVDVTEGNRRIGHAIMDLRYADGGVDMTPVVPGATITAMMEFLPFDAVVPAGHEVRLVITDTVQDYLPSATSSPVVIVGGDLMLPITTPEPTQFFSPPGFGMARP